MEEIDDEDAYPHNVAPLNESSVLELSDGSDDDKCPHSVTADEDGDGDDDAEEVFEEPVYVFFKQTPSIVYIKDRRVHVFECAATRCMGKGNGRMVRRYLDTGDAKSTGNLRKHAKICWGEEAVAAADSTRDVRTAREALSKMK